MSISVLVVEKDALTRETIVYMLEAMRHAVVGFESAKFVGAILDAVLVDVLIVSLAQDDPDGVAIAADAKARHRGIKVLVVSGREPPATLGPFIDGFVQQPFTLKQINDALRNLLPERFA